jgi:hypothetical protein
MTTAAWPATLIGYVAAAASVLFVAGVVAGII